MSFFNTRQRYGALEILLHWVTVLVIVAAYATVELNEIFPKGDPWRETMKNLHGSFGLLVLALVIPRLLLRWVDVRPEVVPPSPLIQQKLGEAAHWGLYALMILLPVLGYLMIDMRGKSVTFFAATLPHLVGEYKALGKALKEVHEFLGDAGYALIALHAGAALFHHYVQRDNTLRRMLPFVSPQARGS